MSERSSKALGHETAAARRARLRLRCLLAYMAIVLAALSLVMGPATAQNTTTQDVTAKNNSPQDSANQSWSLEVPESLAAGPEKWTSPEGLSSTLQVMLMLTVLSLAPAVLMMTTCFVRIIVVLGLLRQAIGTQQLPPSQVITSLALFMTLLVMAPVWKQVYDDAILPYTNQEMDLQEAWDAGAEPIHRFMIMQIHNTENTEDIYLFQSYLRDEPIPQSYAEVPLRTLLPAFMVSELKTAFLIGFQIYLPFLIVDMVIASVMVSMGMLMLPPVLISLPFKLMLFVLLDGWHLVVGMLLQSFVPYT